LVPLRCYDRQGRKWLTEFVTSNAQWAVRISDMPRFEGGKCFAAESAVHLLLLALFPVLLMYRPRLAFLSIVLAIILMYRQRVKNTQRYVRRKYE
jgi:membrane-associated PAP2 superfamily phosphatase